MKTLQQFKLPIIAFVLGAILGRTVIPKTEIKEVVRYQKVIEQQKEQDKKKTVVIVEKKNTDGSSTKETTIKEDTQTNTKSDTKIVDKMDNTKIQSNSQVTVGILALSEINKNILTKSPNYGIIIGVPVVNFVSVTGLLTTDKKIGIGLSIQF